MQKDGLDKYAIDLVARLGGLIRLLDLADDSEYQALEKEEPFRACAQASAGSRDCRR